MSVLGHGFSFNIQIGAATPPSYPTGIDFMSVPPTVPEGGEANVSAQAGDTSKNLITSENYIWTVDYEGNQVDSGRTTGAYSFTVGTPGTYVVNRSTSRRP